MIHRALRLAAIATSLSVVFLVGNCTSSASNTNTSSNTNVSTANTNVATTNSVNADQEVSKLLDEYNDVLLKGDSAALDRIWADDLSFVNPRGELLNKKQRMENIKTGATELQKADVSEKQVRLYGDTAVATLVVKINGQYSGKEADEAFRVTAVFAKPTGTWQMVATQMTPIAK